MNPTIEQIQEAFESWYKEEYVIRQGARGRASRHLEQHDGAYISDHANESYRAFIVGVSFFQPVTTKESEKWTTV